MSTGTTELEHSHVGKTVCVHSHHASRNNKTRYALRNVKVHHTKKHMSTGNTAAAAVRRVLIDADGVVTELNDKAFEAAMNARACGNPWTPCGGRPGKSRWTTTKWPPTSRSSTDPEGTTTS